jgi:predicted TIM-barrel fold metal-dependent hydrolase
METEVTDSKLGYGLIDADNHYYEAEDAFLRHGDEEVRRFVRWIQEGKRRKLVFGEKIADTPANPTFNPIAKAGAFHQRLKDLETGKGRNSDWEFAKSQYGQLEPLPAAYRDRDVRLAVLDDQGVEQCFLFPTLGDCVEGLMMDDPVVGHKAFHAYNLWLEDDWGYGYKGRLWSPPYIPMLDPKLAADELEFVVNRGAKIVSVRPGPGAGRSQADPVFDRFWSIANDAKTFVAYHAYGGWTVYDGAFGDLYGRVPYSDKYYYQLLMHTFNATRGIQETVLGLVLGNLFGRFPNVRVGSIEMGMQWVPATLHALDHAGGIIAREVRAWGTRMADLPSDIMRAHVYVSPFPEEDVIGLTEMIGVDRVLFGSDWPHPEGNITPADYVECIQKLDAADVQKIMRDNALELITR